MQYKKIFIFSLLAFLCFNLCYIKNVFAATAFNAKVTADTLIVRGGPGKNYSKIDQLKKGTIVKVYEQKNGWDRISTGKKWVLNTYLKKTAAAVTTAVIPSKTTEKASNATAVSAATAKDNSSCLQAIKEANTYCRSIASGCPSYSTAPKCVEANKKCEVRQEAALANCPGMN